MIYFKAPLTLAVLTFDKPYGVDHFPFSNVPEAPEARVMTRLIGLQAPPKTDGGGKSEKTMSESFCILKNEFQRLEVGLLMQQAYLKYKD